MMKHDRISADDPRLTAYALGELEGDARAEVETLLRGDPEGRSTVAEIRACAGRLGAALATESSGESPSERGAEPVAEVAEVVSRTESLGPSGRTRPPGWWLGWTGVAALAAACVALALTVLTRTSKPAGPPVPAAMSREAPATALATPVDEPVRTVVAPGPTPERVADAVAIAAPRGLLAQTQFVEEARKLRRWGQPLSQPVFPAPTGTPMGYATAPQEKAAPWSGLDQSLRDPRTDVPWRYGSEPLPQVDREAIAMRARRQMEQHPLARFASLNGALAAHEPTRREPVLLASAPRFDTEAYAYRPDNEFVSVREHPLATFAADVDTASYANARRMLEQGQWPAADAVRIEEWLNYFTYDDPPPSADRQEPLASSLEIAEAPWAPEHRLVRIALKARELPLSARDAANLVFLLDVSGSMNEPNRLPLVKESMRLLLRRLRADDRVAIVTYASGSELVLPSTEVARSREIIAAIDGLHAAGSTNGARGLQLAYEMAKASFVPGGVNRVLLCTDGDFNQGVTSEGELVRLIREKAKAGVFLSVLGFGSGNCKDALLQQVADRGNGHYGYVDTLREAERLLVEQVSGTLVTVAKDVKLQVEFNPARVAQYRLLGYEKRLLAKEAFNVEDADAGELGAGHSVTVLFELIPVRGEMTGADAAAVDPLRYQPSRALPVQLPPEIAAEWLTLKVRYQEPAAQVSRKAEFPLLDRGGRFADASADFKFASAVAGFAMLLRDSPHRGTVTFQRVLDWANDAASHDPGGYRAEFMELVRKAESLSPTK